MHQAAQKSAKISTWNAPRNASLVVPAQMANIMMVKNAWTGINAPATTVKNVMITGHLVTNLAKCGKWSHCLKCFILYWVATGQEMVREKVFSKVTKSHGILLWVSKSWQFYEKSGEIEVTSYNTAVLIPVRQKISGRCDLSDVFPRLRRPKYPSFDEWKGLL